MLPAHNTIFILPNINVVLGWLFLFSLQGTELEGFFWLTCQYNGTQPCYNASRD